MSMKWRPMHGQKRVSGMWARANTSYSLGRLVAKETDHDYPCPNTDSRRIHGLQRIEPVRDIIKHAHNCTSIGGRQI